MVYRFKQLLTDTQEQWLLASTLVHNLGIPWDKKDYGMHDFDKVFF
jgi:hypothetical protein